MDQEKADQPQGGGHDSFYRDHFPVRLCDFGGYSAIVRMIFTDKEKPDLCRVLFFQKIYLEDFSLP